MKVNVASNPRIRFCRAESYLIEGPPDKERLESLGRRFHQALHRIASKRGWTGAVDFCDPAKVLRLPGCVNWKDPKNPKPVQVMFENPARFDPSDLDEILPPLEDGPRVFSIGSQESRPGTQV